MIFQLPLGLRDWASTLFEAHLASTGPRYFVQTTSEVVACRARSFGALVSARISLSAPKPLSSSLLKGTEASGNSRRPVSARCLGTP